MGERSTVPELAIQAAAHALIPDEHADDPRDYVRRQAEADALALAERVVDGIEQAGYAIVPAALVTEVEALYRAWCGDEDACLQPINDEHGIHEGFGGLIVLVAMKAGVYDRVNAERRAADA